jgi:hypothetical protein
LVVVSAENGNSIKLPIAINDKVPAASVVMMQGLPETAELGCPYSYVTVEKYR